MEVNSDLITFILFFGAMWGLGFGFNLVARAFAKLITEHLP